MGLSNAERQRRYRERKRVEQQKASGSVTPAVTETATCNDVTPEAPELGPRGRRLWADLAGEDLRPAERVLVEEACRSADRLDVLDRLLRGDDDAWVRLHAVNEDGSIVKVVLNNALAEARQQQVALKQLLGELRQSRAAGAVPKGAGAGRPSAQREGAGDVSAGSSSSGVTSLAARIAAKRRGEAAG